MKKYTMILALVATAAQAQNTYLNDHISAVDDINGSARYVGMGGALGALGADISVIGSNPAGIGLYRKSDLGITFGAVMPNGNGWQKSVTGQGLATGTFDQAGIVWSTPAQGKLKYVNFAFNYQKKVNYNTGFYADNDALGGLSQMDQLAELATAGYATDYNLAGLAAMPVARDPSMDDYYLSQTDGEYYNEYASQSNQYTRHQSGYMGTFDFNASFNINDLVWLGATFGVDNVDYRDWSEYAEYGTDDGLNSSLYNDTRVSGYGLNMKLGVIVRPIEDDPFRIGVALETPTWYRLTNSTYFYLDQSDDVENCLEFTLRTPTKLRLSAGSTVGDYLAWGIEWEFANYGRTTMGYPIWDGYERSALAGTADVAMNAHTAATLRPQHTLKLGVEYRPISDVALRAGYNFVSSHYRDDATFDQYSIDSQAMDYATSTDYMTLSAANILTLGAGYRTGKFYIDLAYKFRAQRGDFYAFDTTGMVSGISPVDVNLNRHQLTLGMGFKF